MHAINYSSLFYALFQMTLMLTEIALLILNTRRKHEVFWKTGSTQWDVDEIIIRLLHIVREIQDSCTDHCTTQPPCSFKVNNLRK